MDSIAYEVGDPETDAWKERLWKWNRIDVIWLKNQDYAQVFESPAIWRPLLSAIN